MSFIGCKKFVCRSAKLTGPFVQMIYSMIAGDMIRFAIISAIFLVSFSQGSTSISFFKMLIVWPIIISSLSNHSGLAEHSRFSEKKL